MPLLKTIRGFHSMHSENTSIGFVSGLQRQHNDAWSRLEDLYGPLIRVWLRRRGVTGADADDVVQDVFVVALRRLPEFRRRRDGSFRCWLRLIAFNCLRDHRRKSWRHPRGAGGDDVAEVLQQLEDTNGSLTRRWDHEHDKHMLARILMLTKTDFSSTTWAAFYGVAIQGKSPRDVSAALGISENAVCIAKSRVIARMRSRLKDQR